MGVSKLTEQKQKITEAKLEELIEKQVEDFVNEWEISDEEYEELIDEISGEVQIGSLTYSAGRVLREVDPIAFRVGKSEEECPENLQEEKREEVEEELREEYEVVEN